MSTVILVALLVVVAVLAWRIMRQPDTFRIERSLLIDAAPERLFSLVEDFHAWENWSPWAKLDPDAKNAFEGPPAGPGASFSWTGNSKVGAGRMTITESRPAELVRIRLEFLRPMKATNEALFSFRPESGGTRVTWSMSGVNSFMGKAVNLVMDCDRMVGGQFQEGLANLAEQAKRS
ncbi:MAG: SRPBCC family protein [Hyphomicrobiaceae bacterium]